jgi:PAS domain S-box-containing protein
VQLAATHYPALGTSLAPEIIAMMREPFVMLDEDLCLVAGSQAFFLRFGLQAERCLGERIYDLGRGEWDTPGTRELLETIAPRREVVESYVLEVRSPATPNPRVRAAVRPVREGVHRITTFLIAFSEAEDQLPAKWTAGAGSLRSYCGDIIAVLDETRCVRSVEGAVEAILGYTQGELRYLPFASLLHPTESEGVLARLAGLNQAVPHLRLTCRLQHSDGRFLWFELFCEPGTDPHGAPLLHLLARDVSDRRRAEEALRWLSRQNKLVLDSAADGIFGIDRTGSITFINPVAARTLGHRVSDLLGRSYLSVLGLPGDGNAGSEPDLIAQTLQDGLTRSSQEHRFLCSDGTPLCVEQTCSAAREHGQVTGAVVTFRNIAERKRAESAALRAAWLAGVGETTLAVRHEINNPLTTLLAEARLLEMGGNSAGEEREMIKSICQQARRIAGVVRRLAERQSDPQVRLDGQLRMLDLA